MTGVDAQGKLTGTSMLGLNLADENLQETPRRVAQSYLREFLDGYGRDPAVVLSEQFPVSKKADRELVVVTQLKFRSMCPHQANSARRCR